MIDSSSQPKLISGLAEICEKYDGYLIDLWGVTHDGQTPYPNVLETLSFLKENGKSIIFLSNAPRRVSVSRQKLESMGILPDMYDAIHTSGEQTHHFLKSFVQEQGLSAFYHVGTQKDASLYDGIGASKTDDLNQAQFILCSDTLTWDQQIQDLDEVFHQAHQLDLPMICANSDRVVRFQGRLALCAGALAQRYEQMGGKVIYFGKPHASVYEHVFENLSKHPKGRCVAIGDSLYTDIQGAYDQRIDTIFITGGIHLEELGSPWGTMPKNAELIQLIATNQYSPTFVMPSLKIS
jgi:HAD superfamily hydrolase (TIGR01459 family)